MVPAALSIGIDFWKITKACKVSLKNKFPWIKIEDKESYAENDTRSHDAAAIKYLSYVCYPLMFGYSIYSLMYNEHKGWYSYIVNTLVGFVYMFGFIMMTP